MSLYAGGIALATPPDSAISIAPGELPAPPAVSGHAYCLDNNEYGEDLSTMWQQLALQQLDASQQHPEAQQCLTYETQAVSEEDVEQGIDQEIHHLLLMKQQLHNRKQLRQQQAPMLLGPPLASPAPATAGMAEQSLELEFDSWGAMPCTNPHNTTVGAAPAASAFSSHAGQRPRHSIDLGSLASLSNMRQQPALSQGLASAMYSAFSINSTGSPGQQQLPLAGQVSAAAAGRQVGPGLPRSPLPSSTNLAASALPAGGAFSHGSSLLSPAASLQQSAGMLSAPVGLIDNSCGCSTPLLSGELPAGDLQSLLYAPAVPAECAAPATLPPLARGAGLASGQMYSQALGLTDVVPDFSYGGQPQQGLPQPRRSTCGSFGVSPFAVGAHDGVWAAQGAANTAGPLVGAINAAALLQQQHTVMGNRRHSIDVPVMNSVGGQGGFCGLGHQPLAMQQGSFAGAGASQSSWGNNTVQIAGSSRLFASGLGVSCGSSSIQPSVLGQRMGLQGPALSSMSGVALISGALGSNPTVSRRRASMEGYPPGAGRTRGNRRASIDMGAHSSQGATPAAATAAGAMRRGMPAPLLGPSTPSKVTPDGSVCGSPKASPDQQGAAGILQEQASSSTSTSSGNNIERSGSSSSDDCTTDVEVPGDASTRLQFAQAAAPKWAAAAPWHPLAGVVKSGAGKKGTGVFIPGGLQNLALSDAE